MGPTGQQPEENNAGLDESANNMAPPAETPQNPQNPTLPPVPPQPTPNPEQYFASDPASANLPPMAPPPKSHKKRWLIIAGVVLLLIIIAAVLYVMLKPEPKVAEPSLKGASKSSSPKAKTVALQTTYSYLDEPKQLDDLKWFTGLSEWFGYSCEDASTSDCKTPLYTNNDITYTQVATTKDDKAVIVANWGEGEMRSAYVATQNDADSYTILGKLSSLDTSSEYSAEQIKQLKKHLASNVNLDTTTLPEEFAFPASISFKTVDLHSDSDTPIGQYVSSLASIRGGFYNSNIASKDLKVIGTDKSRTYYVVNVSDKPYYQLHEMYGTVSNYFSLPYKVSNGIDNTGETAAAITWTDGSKNKVTYMSRNPGCGSANGYLIAKNVSDKDLTAVGKLADGTVIYQLPNTSQLLLEEYKVDYDKGTNLDDKKLKNLSLDQFQKMHGVIITKNGLGEYAVHLRTDLFFGGGCAKPVVYLYPQQAQMVNVAVGADVKISDPYYPAGGWRNVFALPDSRLLYQGKGYNSLFWEGNGYGEYPIVKAGTVVRSDQAVATIKRQLAEQGFNSTETKDFLEYWQPRLPHTPYVRLTWLNTDQMNQLAPLSITPKPQTVIRTFLQFNGLDKPISLPVQHFNAPARSGFTVTEWGGLQR